MARKKKHEEHVNHEAWAIPYGDLVTLLFALFTVMYAMSSVNEGKFRVLSDSLIAAFHGAPKSLQPVNVGEKEPGKGGEKPLVGITPTALIKLKDRSSDESAPRSPAEGDATARAGAPGALIRIERQVQDAMQALIDANLVTVRRESMWLEIEINTDILFPSGAGDFTPAAAPVLDKLAEVLKPFPNPIRVEGHTDDRPIRTAAFPSNWELSAARAASVVHEFTKAGVDPLRLEIVGFGEFHPRQSNDTPEGRNANRRVAILVLEQVDPGAPVTVIASDATPQHPAPGVDLADGRSAANRYLPRVTAAQLGDAVRPQPAVATGAGAVPAGGAPAPSGSVAPNGALAPSGSVAPSSAAAPVGLSVPADRSAATD